MGPWVFTWMFPLCQVAGHLALSSPPTLRVSQSSLIQAQVFGQPQLGEGKGPEYMGMGMLSPITYWGVT